LHSDSECSRHDKHAGTLVSLLSFLHGLPGLERWKAQIPGDTMKTGLRWRFNLAHDSAIAVFDCEHDGWSIFASFSED
jgi:bacterioferritin (cytochrome b1)